MRWGRLAVLYVVLAVLAVEYRRVTATSPAAPEAVASRPRFLPIDPDALREVRLVRDGYRVVGRRQGDGWEVVEPVGANIPSGLIAAFTSALAGAEEIERVGGAEADAAAFGLTAGAVRVELVPEAGEALVVTMGQTNPTGTAIYAQRVGAPEVILIGRQVRYYEDLIFQALAGSRVPTADDAAPVGG